MTIKWMALIIGCVLASMLTVWAALKAFNGIVYELRLTKAYLRQDEEA